MDFTNTSTFVDEPLSNQELSEALTNRTVYNIRLAVDYVPTNSYHLIVLKYLHSLYMTKWQVNHIFDPNNSTPILGGHYTGQKCVYNPNGKYDKTYHASGSSYGEIPIYPRYYNP